jgi:hypothetical protein
MALERMSDLTSRARPGPTDLRQAEDWAIRVPLPLALERYCRWLAHYFYARGYEPDDLYQEALLAAWLAPGQERVAARRQVLDIVKIASRKPLLVAEVDVSSGGDTIDQVEARERLRSLLRCPPNERRALGRVIRGEPIRRHEKALQSSLFRARRRLAWL